MDLIHRLLGNFSFFLRLLLFAVHVAAFIADASHYAYGVIPFNVKALYSVTWIRLVSISPYRMLE